MLYTGKNVLRHYVGFSQIGSHIHTWLKTKLLQYQILTFFCNKVIRFDEQRRGDPFASRFVDSGNSSLQFGQDLF